MRMMLTMMEITLIKLSHPDFLPNVTSYIICNIQAGAELGQAQFKLNQDLKPTGIDFTDWCKKNVCQKIYCDFELYATS